MKKLLVKLISELTEVLESGTFSQEDKIRLINAKKNAEKALETYEITEKAKFTILIWEVVKLLVEVFTK